MEYAEQGEIFTHIENSSFFRTFIVLSIKPKGMFVYFHSGSTKSGEVKALIEEKDKEWMVEIYMDLLLF